MLVLLNLKKAFNTANHAILPDKLKRYCIGGKSLFLKNYPTSRKQFVILNEFQSDFSDVLCMVP